MRSHHDVLGIRPNAGREEIELAYKGRRSQYHPDRYAQSDPETQAWATACMQEVNAAYEALINRRPSAGSEATASRQPASQPSTSAPMTLGQALRAHPISKTAMARIYIAPNIPLKKLHNALESYGQGLKPSDVLVLLDDTIFSSGKDGLLVTERELRVKEAFNPPETFALDGIALGIRGGDLYINNRRARDFNITERGEAADVRHEEFRDDRYVAALKLDQGQEAHVFYLVRAVSPGTYRVPPPIVEDMYRPEVRGIGKSEPATIKVVEP